MIEGGFLDRAENLLVFGLPGRGKTHFLCALGRELTLKRGRRIYFTPTFKLVQQLLTAKKDLRLDALGEIAGWAMPDDFPPRNGRTSKALTALGFPVTIHSE